MGAEFQLKDFAELFSALLALHVPLHATLDKIKSAHHELTTKLENDAGQTPTNQARREALDKARDFLITHHATIQDVFQGFNFSSLQNIPADTQPKITFAYDEQRKNVSDALGSNAVPAKTVPPRPK